MFTDSFVEHNVALTKRVEDLRWTVKSKIESIREANKNRINEERVLLQTLIRSSKKGRALELDLDRAIVQLEDKIKSDSVTEECESRFRAYINEKEDLAKAAVVDLNKCRNLLSSAEIFSAKPEKCSTIDDQRGSNLLLQFCPTFFELLRLSKLLHDFLLHVEMSNFADSFKGLKREYVTTMEAIETVKHKAEMEEDSIEAKVNELAAKKKILAEMGSCNTTIDQEIIEMLKHNSTDLQDEISTCRNAIILCEKNTADLRDEVAKMSSIKDEVEGEIKVALLNEELAAQKLSSFNKEIEDNQLVLTNSLKEIKTIEEKKATLLESIEHIQVQRSTVEEEAACMLDEVEKISISTMNKSKNNSVVLAELDALQDKISIAQENIEKMEKELHLCESGSEILQKEKECIAKELKYLSSLSPPLQQNARSQSAGANTSVHESVNVSTVNTSSFRNDLITRARSLKRSE